MTQKKCLLSSVASQGIRKVTGSCPFVLLDFSTHQVKALIDSGYVRSMCRTVFDKLNDLGQVKSIEPITIQCITAAQTTLPVDMMASIQFKIEGFSWRWKFLVVSRFGADFIASTGFISDLCSSKWVFNFKPKVAISLTGITLYDGGIWELSYPTERAEPGPLDHTRPEHQDEWSTLCDRYPEVLAKKLGLTNLLEYKIKIISDKMVRHIHISWIHLKWKL